MIKIPIWDLILCGVYRPPDTKINEWNEALTKISEALKDNQSIMNHNIIISDYMNFADAKWDEINDGITGENNQICEIQKIMRDNFLNQIIDIPTRNDRILDVIMTNNEKLFSHHEIIVNTDFSDHNSVILTMNIMHEKKKKTNDIHNKYDAKVHGELPAIRC